MLEESLETIERRKTKRRQAHGKVFVLFDQYHISVGQLLNICRGGLCCLTENAEHLEGTQAISLVCYEEDNNYTAIHSLPLNALDWQEEGNRKGVGQKIRLRFAPLTTCQQSQLSRFLSEHSGFSGTDHAPA